MISVIFIFFIKVKKICFAGKCLICYKNRYQSDERHRIFKLCKIIYQTAEKAVSGLEIPNKISKFSMFMNGLLGARWGLTIPETPKMNAPSLRLYGVAPMLRRPVI